MDSWTRGVKGDTGQQGPPGKPCRDCSHSHLPKPVTTRYIKQGGKRSLQATDKIVIINSQEKVVLVLPEIETNKEFFDDQYYHSYNITIKMLNGSHKIISTGGKINKLVTSVDLDNGAAKYEFTSTPDGWLMLIFKSGY